VRKATGTNLKNNRTAEVIYTPPVGESAIKEKLANWEFYLHQNEVDPLVAMAVMHYQFEAIHPFWDGNGRTGRILNILFLVEKQMLAQPILYLSKFIVENKEEYYRLLLRIMQNNEWEPWICFMLDAIRIMSDWTIEKVNAVVRLQKETAEFVKEQAKNTYSHEIITLLFQNPYVRSRNLTQAGLFKSRQAAMKNLRKLEELGVLESREAGKEVLFLHKRLHFLMANDVNDYEPLGEKQK
jgi:Fic family protein